MADQINHEELAISRLATQYRESTNLINYIKVLLSEADTLEEVFLSLLEERWIDTAVGINLDVLGSIVGQSRELIAASELYYFGFQGFLQSGSFGSLYDASSGARFKSLYESSVGFRLLTDDEYRLWIRAKIIRNTTKSTPEDIIYLLKFVFEVEKVLLIEGNTRYTVSLSRGLNINQKYVLLFTNIIPKTAGVTVTYYVEFDPDNFFGFKGVIGAKGFGSLDNLNVGGTFANLIYKENQLWPQISLI